MPKSSTFEIHRSGAERHNPEEKARKYTLPYFEVLRARMILMAAGGRRNDAIAVVLSIGRDVVRF